MLSLAINCLVLIILLEKSVDLLFMRDPAVTITSRTIFKEEVEEAGLVNLGQH